MHAILCYTDIFYEVYFKNSFTDLTFRVHLIKCTGWPKAYKVGYSILAGFDLVNFNLFATLLG